jgi:hypothetical protein
MIPDAANPASAAARTGSGNDVCFGGEQFPDSALAQKYEAQNLVRRFGVRHDHLRLVPRPPPPRSRRIEVRISAMDGRTPIGRSRLLRLRESDLQELIDHAA